MGWIIAIYCRTRVRAPDTSQTMSILSGQLEERNSLLNKTNAICAYPVYEEISELASDLDEEDTRLTSYIKWHLDRFIDWWNLTSRML